jgi:hypothetical protein
LYIKDSNITSGAQRKIFENGTIFFGEGEYIYVHIKGKVDPITGHEGPEMEQRNSSTLF